MLQLLGAAQRCAALVATFLRACEVAHKLVAELQLQQSFDHVAELQLWANAAAIAAAKVAAGF